MNIRSAVSPNYFFTRSRGSEIQSLSFGGAEVLGAHETQQHDVENPSDAGLSGLDLFSVSPSSQQSSLLTTLYFFRRKIGVTNSRHAAH